MNKIISAQSILKQKGFVQNKFDTNGFMQAVGQYFLDNSVEAKLLLVPFRFLDIKREVIDGIECETFNPFHIEKDEEAVGYKVQTATNSAGEIAYARLLFEFDFDNFQQQREAGILVPRIVVDRPFFENAAATLRLMGGYVVEKQTKKKRKLYWVSLL